MNSQGPSHQSKYPRSYSRPVYQIDDQQNKEPKREEFPVYNVGESDELITCCIGGVDVTMLIDSGSKHNLIDDTTWEIMKLQDVNIRNERFDHDKRFLAY